MDHEHAQKLVERMVVAWIQADVPAILALFVVDGVLISPGGRAQGHAAIAAQAAEFFAGTRSVTATIKRVLLDGDAGAVEWIWRETNQATGESRTIEDAIVFELREGKFSYWREYFDPRQIREV
jgi:uncharacterized protein (TIGR02246 family)